MHTNPAQMALFASNDNPYASVQELLGEIEREQIPESLLQLARQLQEELSVRHELNGQRFE